MLHELPDNTKEILNSVLSRLDNESLKYQIEILVTQAYLAGKEYVGKESNSVR